MIKKSLVITAIILLTFILNGCQKKPKLEDAQIGKNNVYDATDISGGNTVSIDENAYGNENNGSGGSGDSTLNGSSDRDVLNASSTNSSSNGFRSLYFGFGDYGISAGMESRMASNVNVAQRTNQKIKIEGNCDEFGTDEYNYALGLKRAKAVKDNLVASGVPSNKMVIVSFGESNPVCSSPTDECYARNRRVDLHLAQ